VLKADVVYAVLIVAGAMVATLTPAPAAVAALLLACSATVGGLMCSRSLWREVPWNVHGAPHILRSIAPIGVVTAGGAAIHWVFSQGYNFLVAGTLDVTAVAAIAATRILIMPINLLSTGIGTMMLPTTSNWLQKLETPVVLRRLLFIATTLALAAVGYFGVLWLVRDWLFTTLLKKNFAQRDQLLLLWYAVGILMLLRDQLIHLPLARSRFHILTVLTSVSALLSLAVSYVSMRMVGVTGALLGVITGETVSVVGLLILSFLEARRPSRIALSA
jgi:O-antigen/teichoic acid export membrane protein